MIKSTYFPPLIQTFSEWATEIQVARVTDFKIAKWTCFCQGFDKLRNSGWVYEARNVYKWQI